MVLEGKRGFVYASGDEHPLRDAVPGARFTLPSPCSPWFVVDHVLENILVVGWPGRLWSVEIVHADPEAQKGLIPNAGYTRAEAVDIIDEVPVARLFGPQGEAVCLIIEAARRLKRDQVDRLAAAHSDRARAVYSTAWQKWNAAGLRAGSPINFGFWVIYNMVSNRAQALVGDAAFVTDEDQTRSLGPLWSRAGEALIDAAMAAGRPELVSEQDRKTLTAAWEAVYGAI